MGIGIKELLVVLVVVLVIFGTKRLRNVGGDIGEAIKGFRRAMNDSEQTDDKNKDTETNNDKEKLP